MPEYRCHKKVRALKIASVEFVAENKVVLTYEGIDGSSLYDVTKKPTPEPGYYVVQYEDGYISFSPAEAFEEGYTLITA